MFTFIKAKTIADITDAFLLKFGWIFGTQNTNHMRHLTQKNMLIKISLITRWNIYVNLLNNRPYFPPFYVREDLSEHLRPSVRSPVPRQKSGSTLQLCVCFTDPYNHTYSESSWHVLSTDAPGMTMTKTNTKTKTMTKTKLLKDPTCAIFLAVQNSSIGHLVTNWLTDSLTDSGLY